MSGSYFKKPKAMFCLVKGDYRLQALGFWGFSGLKRTQRVQIPRTQAFFGTLGVQGSSLGFRDPRTQGLLYIYIYIYVRVYWG